MPILLQDQLQGRFGSVVNSVRFRKQYGWFLTYILERLMADVAQIKQDITDLQGAQAGAVNELQTLADQVAQLQSAGADAITDAQLEELHNNLQSVTSALSQATSEAQGGGAQAPAAGDATAGGAPAAGDTAPGDAPAAPAGAQPEQGDGVDVGGATADPNAPGGAA